MKLSIIICTHNRAAILRECLASLTCQTANANDYEILIIDNNSNDDTKDVYDSLSNQLTNSRYIFESAQGLSYARNRGFKEARSNWILYLDDDTKAFETFSERAIYVTENYNFDCFGGVFLPWYKNGKPKWFPDHLVSNEHLSTETCALENGYATGCVVAFKKSILIELGGFPASIGMSGNKVAYGEETLLQVKIRENGGTIGFDPELKIFHLVDNYKLTPIWFIKSAYAKGRDSWAGMNNQPTLAKVLFIPLSISRRAIKKIFLSTIALFNKNYYFQNWIIDVTSLLASGIGKFIKGLSLLIKAK